MRKALTLLFVFVTILSLCGCEDKEKPISRWEYVGTIEAGLDEQQVFYDVNTKVMYALGYRTCTVLLNSDGTPMLWKGGAE